jgi:DNA repair exonuclease SbcCD nuclease subunit
MGMICCSDLHLRSDVPECRKETPEEWLQHQKVRLDFIRNCANVSNQSVIISGDIFDSPRPPLSVVNMFLEFISEVDRDVYVIAGNHDLHSRSTDLSNTAFGTVVLSNLCKVLPMDDEWVSGLPYSDLPLKDWITCNRKGFLAIHAFIVEKESDINPLFKIPQNVALDVLKKYPQKYIITGDNHHSFLVEHEGRFLINCGSLTKQKSTDKDKELYIWEVLDNNVTRIPLPVDLGCYDSHLEIVHLRSGITTALVERLQNEKGDSINFDEIVENGLTNNEVSGYTQEVVKNLMEVQV